MGTNRNWQQSPNDNYQEWLIKAIPSETIALYLTLHSFIISWEDRPDAIMWVALGLCTAAAPFFLLRGGVNRVSQHIVATIAVPIWVMSVPQSAWWQIDGWNSAIGGIAISVYVMLLAPFIAYLAVKI